MVWRKCIWLATRWGGRLALYAAGQVPHKINSLILESANPGLRDESARQARIKLDDERATTMRRVGMERFVEQWYQMGLFASLKNHPQALAQTKRSRNQNNVQWAAKVIAELSPGRQPPVWGQVSSSVDASAVIGRCVGQQICDPR